MTSNQSWLSSRTSRKQGQGLGKHGWMMGRREFAGMLMLLLALAPRVQAQFTLPNAAPVDAATDASLIIGDELAPVDDDSASMADRLRTLEAKFAELQAAEQQRAAMVVSDLSIPV